MMSKTWAIYKNWIKPRIQSNIPLHFTEIWKWTTMLEPSGSFAQHRNESQLPSLENSCYYWSINVETVPHTWIISYQVVIANIRYLTTRTRLGQATVGVPLITYSGGDKMVATFQTAFSITFSWMKMKEFPFKFHRNLLQMVQLTIIQHCFKWFRLALLRRRGII